MITLVPTRQKGVPEVPTVQAPEHPLPMVFIGEHDIGDAAHGAQDVDRWKVEPDHAGRETRHGRSVTNPRGLSVHFRTPSHTADACDRCCWCLRLSKGTQHRIDFSSDVLGCRVGRWRLRTEQGRKISGEFLDTFQTCSHRISR